MPAGPEDRGPFAASPKGKDIYDALQAIKEAVQNLAVTIDPGDVQIGAVEIKDGATDTRAKVGVGTAIVAGDVAIAVKDPVIGKTDGAAVMTDVDGTIQQYLRGLVKGLLVNGVSLKPSTAGGEGQQEVAAAATPEQLAANQACTSVAITAQIGNTKQVAIGFSNAVRATAGAEIGMQLQPGDTVVYNVDNLNKIWVDAQVNGEGVSFTYTAD